MKRFVAIVLSTLFLNGVVHAGMGVSFMTGILSSEGTETENSGSRESEVNTKDLHEAFYGASLYYEADVNGITYGIDYVPLKLEIGSGSRSDTTSDGNETTSDTGSYSAEANVEHLTTVYSNIPMGAGGWYGVLGVHYAEITSDESLPNSTYGDEKVFGAQVGFGLKQDNLKYELSYSDFEDISLNSTSGSSSITADADALTLKIAYGF